MRLIVLVLLLLCSNTLRAQKENNVWVGGNYVGIDFNSGSPVTFARTDDDNFWRTNASISDTDGNLLFYTNGYRIFNKNFDVMQNGDALDIGDYEQWGYNQLSVQDGAVIVPKPNDAAKYYVFHYDLNLLDYDTVGVTLIPTHLFYCLVDMNLNGGLGGVVAGQKDIVVLSDTLTASGIKAVKHANGRDYWLICHEASSNRYYRFVVDPFGIHGPYEQYTGIMFNGLAGMSAYIPMAFSKDATKAAQLSAHTMTVMLYDFDRCAGILYNPDTIHISDTLYYAEDVEFSPSGKYIYVTANHWNYIFQFDTWASNIEASKQLVAVYNGITDPFPINYDKLCLGPDDKIYVSTFDATEALSVINVPDNAGTDCDFQSHAIDLSPPGNNWSGLPNTVNYSLSALVGSGCDTITSTNHLPSPIFTWSVYPNPVADELQLSVTGVTTKAFLEVVNVLGQKVYRQTIESTNHAIHQPVNMSNVAAGVYMISLQVNGQHYTRKIVRSY